MNFKDLFYFSKSQKVGIVLLLGLIFLTWLVGILLPYILPGERMNVDEKFLTEAREFKNNLKEKEATWNNFENGAYKKKYPYQNYENTRYELFLFDPNTADSTTFVRLGLKPYVARNIQKYRSKGGKYRTVESFGKVYGITAEKFEELKPYISIKGDGTSAKTEIKREENVVSEKPIKETIVVELNDADTTMLQKIEGVGKTYAKRITGYRRLLGGYIGVEQIREIYGMTADNYDKIAPQCRVDASKIEKINVNTASIERLKAHPYIKTFQKAKALYEYRRKKVKLKNIDELKIVDELSEEDLNRIKPYLSFE
ncbi:MAG: helix-hairpin-helix domain-containing protein [Paludibacteraceae bacterium]